MHGWHKPFGGANSSHQQGLLRDNELGGAYNGGTIFKITASGALTTLYSFCAQASCTDGAYPYAGLVQGTDGNFHGTTYSGGAFTSTDCPNGCDTVFKIAPKGPLTTLHSFDGSDGFGPRAGLIQANHGDFYGTTEFGGDNNAGTVFRMTPDGTLSTIHSFCAFEECSDGYGPWAGLIQGSDGYFYGTTYHGGPTS